MNRKTKSILWLQAKYLWRNVCGSASDSKEPQNQSHSIYKVTRRTVIMVKVHYGWLPVSHSEANDVGQNLCKYLNLHGYCGSGQLEWE